MDTGTEIRKILEVTRVELTHHAENENKQGIIECLGRLHQLLGRDVEEAVKLVNSGYVKVIQDVSSGRKIIRVITKSATKFYHLFPLINYCPCSEFKEFVIDAKLKFMCQHTIASYIFLALEDITGNNNTILLEDTDNDNQMDDGTKDEEGSPIVLVDDKNIVSEIIKNLYKNTCTFDDCNNEM